MGIDKSELVNGANKWRHHLRHPRRGEAGRGELGLISKKQGSNRIIGEEGKEKGKIYFNSADVDLHVSD